MNKRGYTKKPTQAWIFSILGEFWVHQRIQSPIFQKPNMQFSKFFCKTPNYGPMINQWSNLTWWFFPREPELFKLEQASLYTLVCSFIPSIVNHHQINFMCFVSTTVRINKESSSHTLPCDILEQMEYISPISWYPSLLDIWVEAILNNLVSPVNIRSSWSHPDGSWIQGTLRAWTQSLWVWKVLSILFDLQNTQLNRRQIHTLSIYIQ
jgi:hypothetical protein